MKRSLATALLAAAAFASPAAHAAEILGTLHVLKHIPLNAVEAQNAKPGAPSPNLVDPLAIFSNVTTAGPGNGLPQNPSAPVGSGAFITRVMMDDLTFTTNPGVGLVTTVRFSVFNLGDNGPVTARPRLRFWNANGTHVGALVGPGTYYAPATPGGPLGFTFPPKTFAAGTTILEADVSGGFTVPAGTTTTLWAGVTFDSDNGAGGNTGATQAQINGLGQRFYSPIDVGSSFDLFFETDAAGSFLGVDNPPGNFGNVAGNPLANFGWELVVSTLPVELQSFSIQ